MFYRHSKSNDHSLKAVMKIKSKECQKIYNPEDNSQKFRSMIGQ